MQNRFESELERFCAKHDITVGANAGIFWANEHGVTWGGLALIQNIPRRVWVGLKRVEKISYGTGPIQILPSGYHKVWIPDLGLIDFNKFKPTSDTSEWEERTEVIQNVINGLLKIHDVKLFFDLKGMPLEVSILTNIRSGSGCNFSGAFSVALFTAIRLMAEECGTVSDSIYLNNYIKDSKQGFKAITWGSDFMKVLNDPHSHLHKLNRASLLLEMHFHGNAASGYGTILPLIPTKWPVLYVRETPSNERIGKKIPINNWEKLTKSDHNLLTRKILDTDNGLQYKLVLMENTPGWPKNPPTRFPFCFGLLYSGSPKDTANSINHVREKTKSIFKSLPKLFSFFKSHKFDNCFQEVEIPMGLKFFEDFIQSPETALHKTYEGLMPSALYVMASFLDCINSYNTSSKTQDNALEKFTAAIWGVQDGLAQLGLIDNKARWVIGRFVEYMKDRKGPYAIKYTGGCLGGYLVVVAHYKTDLQLFHSFLLKSDTNKYLSRKNDFDLPRFDYYNTHEEPDDKGLITSINLISGKPKQWHMICYKPTSDGWGKDKYLSHDHMFEWEWNQHIQENSKKGNYCMIELDFRRNNNAKGQIFIKGQSLKGYRRNQVQGEAPLAHAIYVMLSKGGSCSAKDLKDHFGPIGFGEKSFLTPSDARKFFLNEIEKLPVWKSLFLPIVFPPLKYLDDLSIISVLPKSSSIRVLVYMKNR